MNPRRRIDGRRIARGTVVALSRFVVAFAVYAGTVALLDLIEPGALSMSRLPLWVVLGSTALVAWLLRLLRSLIDAFADLVVYRDRASGYSAARDLVSTLSMSVPIDEVLPQLAATIGQVARTPRAEVRFWVAPEQRWTQVWPPAAARQGDPLTVEVRHLGTDIGEFEIDQVDGILDDVGRRRLGGLAAPVGAALATVRLTHALRLRRTELEQLTAAIDASTRRLLGARYAAREEFREHLAARVLPHLDTALAAGSPEVAAAQVTEALDAVRTLSRGIFPPRLGEAGLAGCLSDWAAAMPGVTLGQVDEGWSAELRSCLYFSVVTTATELVGAGAARVRIDVRRSGRTAELAVGAEPAAEAEWPMASRDRLEAFDAELGRSRAGESTVLTAVVPVVERPGS